MSRAEQGQPLLEPTAQRDLGLVEEPEREIGAPDRDAHAGLHERLRGQLIVHARRRRVEDLAHGDGGAALARIDRGQHLLQEQHRGIGLVARDYDQEVTVYPDVSGGVTLGAVLLGGPMGSLLFPDAWDAPICYGAMGDRGIHLGHGGLVAVPADASPALLFRHLLDFAARESCGRCLPCALGAARAAALARQGPPARAGIERLFELMEQASLCGFGQLVPGPMRELLARHGDAALAPGAPA